MERYIALLRGINVSGRNKIKMAELRQLWTGLGCTEVTTYLQSGNVVLAHETRGEQAAADLAAAGHAAIKEQLGLEVPVLVLSAARFHHLAEANPLLQRSGVDRSFLHLAFLFQAPVKELEPDKLPSTGDEQAVLHEGQIYLYCPYGCARTKLTNSYFERALGVPATSRNWRTVEAISKLLRGPDV
jgi:uncharacterized protein (DUF1697 family)